MVMQALEKGVCSYLMYHEAEKVLHMRNGVLVTVMDLIDSV